MTPDIRLSPDSAKDPYSQLLALDQNRDPNIISEVAVQFGRNRYPGILPNEPTRFKILEEPKFYFNANWVLKGHAIACQGPLPKEIDHFWKMVSHSEVQAIVMLTNLVEGQRTKCSEYWKKMKFVEEKLFENGTEVIVKRTIVSNDAKTFTQYHLQNWPDNGIVSAETLAELVRLVAQEKGKLLVHCSAGIGRTGTFLAAYEAYRQGQTEIFPIAAELRNPLLGRVGLIQSRDQYLLASKTAQKLLLNQNNSL